VKVERGRGERGRGNKTKKEISLGRWCDTRVPRFFGRGNICLAKTLTGKFINKFQAFSHVILRAQPITSGPIIPFSSFYLRN
jgi:hypothetical protein